MDHIIESESLFCRYCQKPISMFVSQLGELIPIETNITTIVNCSKPTLSQGYEAHKNYCTHPERLPDLFPKIKFPELNNGKPITENLKDALKMIQKIQSLPKEHNTPNTHHEENKEQYQIAKKEAEGIINANKLKQEEHKIKPLNPQTKINTNISKNTKLPE